jgi:hypothetical protein
MKRIAMKIPKTVKIGAKTFSVSFNDPVSQDMSTDGYINYGQQKIVLRNHLLNKERQEQAFIHEITHAIDDSFCIKDSGEKLTESEVERLSSSFYQIVKENKIF